MDRSEPPPHVVDRAVHEARQSPCAKSKRGCAIFIERTRPPGSTLDYRVPMVTISGQGYNGPPYGRLSCSRDTECEILCSRLCIHAEVRAIIDMLRLGIVTVADGAELVHVKVDIKGQLVAGGPPSCWPCANLIAETGLHAVWLYEDMWEGPRWTRWLAGMFHTSTLKRQSVHPDYEPRNAIEKPCGDDECARLDGAKRDRKGFWRCVKCGYPSA